MKIDTNLTDTELAFKNWLRDTTYLLNITQNAYNSTLSLNRKYTVSADSLKLVISNEYKMSLNPKLIGKVKEKDIRNILKLLSEYHELPKNNFEINISTIYNYNPSDIYPILIKETYLEYKKIRIIIKNSAKRKTIADYEFVRGLLSYKTTIEVAENGNKTFERIDFIWDGNKLTKEKRN